MHVPIVYHCFYGHHYCYYFNNNLRRFNWLSTVNDTNSIKNSFSIYKRKMTSLKVFQTLLKQPGIFGNALKHVLRLILRFRIPNFEFAVHTLNRFRSAKI